MAISTGAAILGGSVVAGVLGSKSAKKQAQVGQQQIGESGRQFDLVREDTRPAREVGQSALFTLADLYGLPRPKPGEDLAFNPATGTFDAPGTATGAASLGPDGAPVSIDLPGSRKAMAFGVPGAATPRAAPGPGGIPARRTPQQILESTPGFKFRLDQGRKTLQNAQSASRAGGGRFLKEGVRFNQGFASNEFGNLAEALFRLTGSGANAVNTSAGAGSRVAGSPGFANLAEGNAGGPAAINNAIQGGLGNFTTLQIYNDLLSKLTPRPPPTPLQLSGPF